MQPLVTPPQEVRNLSREPTHPTTAPAQHHPRTVYPHPRVCGSAHPSRSRYIAITQQPHGNHMASTLQSRSNQWHSPIAEQTPAARSWVRSSARADGSAAVTTRPRASAVAVARSPVRRGDPSQPAAITRVVNTLEPESAAARRGRGGDCGEGGAREVVGSGRAKAGDGGVSQWNRSEPTRKQLKTRSKTLGSTCFQKAHISCGTQQSEAAIT